MLLDTTILIDILRGNKQTKDFFQQKKGQSFISSITSMELIVGARNRQEEQAIKTSLQALQLETVWVNQTVAKTALKLLEQYQRQVSLGIPDAFIAATAMENHLTLVTGNIKHFRIIKGLKLKTW